MSQFRSVAARAPRTAALALPVIAWMTTPASADEIAQTLPDVVVSATRIPTPATEVASSVTVITQDDIERKQYRTLPDALADVPGLNLVQSGGPGGTTAVFIRGTNANHTKVLIDGVDASDPSSPDGSFDFAHLPLFGVQRIEVLRGPQSGLYGSDAIGGVINIITKAGSGPPHLEASVEGGSYGTFNQAGSASGSTGRVSYAFDLSHLHTDSTPVTPLDLLPPGELRNNDAYDNKSVGAKLGMQLLDNFDVGLVTRYIDTDLRFTGDENVGPFPDPTQSDSQTRQLFTRATAHILSLDGRFDQTLGIGYTDYRRRDLTPGAEPSFNRGDRVKLDWQGNLRIAEGEIVTLGAEHQLDEIRDSPISAQTTNNAGFVQLQSSVDGRFFNTVSLRYDSNDRFGDNATYRVAPAYLITETGTKLKGSVGTGFKAPTLNQLFVNFPAFGFLANPALKPEKSFGWDAGFEQVLGPRVQAGATYFHNNIDNLIAANDTFTTDINIAKAVTYGVESFVAYAPIDSVKLRADYTYTMAKDAVLNEELLRRPKHKASLDAAWRASDAATLSATLLYVGPWVDGSRDFSVPRLKSDGYATVNLAASYDIAKNLTAYARINNLLDRHYQDPVGFLHQGFGIFFGVRVGFDALASQG
jgi:vitamin B12 transporter